MGKATRPRLLSLKTAFCLVILLVSRVAVLASLTHQDDDDNADKSPAFLLLCLTDGSLVSMNAWTGELETRIYTDPLLQKRVRTPLAASDDAAIVPGLDGRLYSYYQEEGQDNFPQLQALPLTIHSILDHPVRSCRPGNENDCGILTATAQTSLLALDDRGHLLWKSEVRDDNSESERENSLLLQRRDYWVQHVSIATGMQAWNVSLGTYQALDFSTGKLDQKVASIDDDDDISDDGEPFPDSFSSFELPSILFSNEGHTLTAVDPKTDNILWRQTTNSVLSSVFGISRGRWQTLNVLEHPPDDQDASATGSILDEFALTRKKDPNDKEFWSRAAWEAARMQYRQEHPGSNINAYGAQRLLPAEAPEPEFVQQQRQRQQHHQQQCLLGSCTDFLDKQCPSGDCKLPKSFLLPASTPTPLSSNNGAVQPSGILLTWRLVEYLIVFAIALVIGLRHWYLRKKQKWMLENSTKTSSTAPMPALTTNSSENSGNTVPRRFRRCSSMPESIAGIPPFRNRSDPGEIPLTRAKSDSVDLTKSTSPLQNNDSKTALSPKLEAIASPLPPPPVIQSAGIPLVRYSRYASEFEEMDAMGKGGFGTVFRCKNVLDGREYAIKKISIHGAVGDQSFQKRLQRVLREVKILAVLDHPNIVRYYTAWLELVEGEETPERIKKNSGGSNGYDDSTAMSRRFSSSNLLGDSVSQWEPESPSYRRGAVPAYRAPPNPLGWDSMFDENSASLRRSVRNDGDDFAFFEESNDDDSGDQGETKTRDVNEETIASARETIWMPSTSTIGKLDGTSRLKPKKKSAVPDSSIRHTLYIQMQLCGQRTVAEFLSDASARKGSAECGVDIPAALQMFLQISQAVQYVHGQGLIHRDLKPSNCFMDTSGSIKVGDFGLSREAATEDDPLNTTAANRNESMCVGDAHTSGVGTRAYASPEQTNASDYDSSTDVYSLGIILFELCYPMYTGMERNICLSRLREFQFPADWEKCVGAAFPTMKGLITSMLSKNPAERPTADSIATTIQSILGEFTILSLDNEHGPEVILLRVEAEHRDDALGHTIQLIRSAAEGRSPVKVVQYGLRSAWSNEQPAAIMEFALQSKDPSKQGPELVAQLAERPEIYNVRQVSHSSHFPK